jgi:hypothetical protein
MSPARSKRKPTPKGRDRAEIVKSVGVAAAIVIVTALLVWLLRPGPPGVPATGGLMNRQPRVSWLIGIALGAAGLATWWVLRKSPRAKARGKIVFPITFGVIVVATVIGGFLWPGGLLRHDVAPAPVPEPEPTPSTSVPAQTTTPNTPTTVTGTTTAVTPTTVPTESPSTTGSP